ncbi:MAG: hypothetical protein HY722_12645 [Planctomycetes bacterium]|nr:hypothetical protein [Planctomycetota bacterium]
MRAFWAIARTTRQEALRQPTIYLVTACFAALIVSAPYVAYFAFGNERALISEMATASLTLCGMLTAVFSSSDVHGAQGGARPLWYLLARPIGRATILAGRFLGVLQALGLVCLVLVAALALALYLQGELALRPVSGGLALVALELVLMAAIATAASSRLPLVGTTLVVFAVYALGHMNPYLSERMAESGPAGVWVARVYRLLVPNLECFNPAEVLWRDRMPTAELLGWAGLYAASYTLAALGLALGLFHKRDIA